ncbi:MAG TPA: alpha/beta fold hydrolase, partial [Ktedonobacteraceae bacterium]|nr:alpha/beta fold hydrolase [Ktedonobacteraceae bacterium]
PALVSAGFRVVVPDLRGRGKSDKPERVEDYSLSAIMKDVAGIMDAVGIERAHVVGRSRRLVPGGHHAASRRSVGRHLRRAPGCHGPPDAGAAAEELELQPLSLPGTGGRGIAERRLVPVSRVHTRKRRHRGLH